MPRASVHENRSRGHGRIGIHCSLQSSNLANRSWWDAETTAQIPDQEIASRSTTGAPNSGMVSFEPLSDSRSRVTLQLEAEPRSMTEKAGDALGFLDRQVKNDLERFRKFIEGRGGRATGAWRGQVT